VKKILKYFYIILIALPLALGACSPGTGTTTAATVTSASPTATTTKYDNYAPGEAKEFQGVTLTPMSLQRNNALAGTQTIDKDSYVLTVDGLVDTPLKLTYADLLALPQNERLQPLNCVEGWSFTAKWTGPSFKDILSRAGIKPEGKIVIFYTTDATTGYTSLDLPYILDNDIIIGLKNNDLTLPPERGFPFQVVAMSKYGYKWAKWVTRIEVSANTDFRGYWEIYGYSNDADDKGPAFDK
jgi:DMSO/TMAO reductase YedYZ molybdopterin-dependent catalytic subunit